MRPRPLKPFRAQVSSDGVPGGQMLLERVARPVLRLAQPKLTQREGQAFLQAKQVRLSCSDITLPASTLRYRISTCSVRVAARSIRMRCVADGLAPDVRSQLGRHAMLEPALAAKR